MIDDYAQSAEFIDPLISPFWDSFGPALTRAITNPTPAAGPVIDVGAGSGRGTLLAGKALPEAEIFAVEPSPGLRSVLLALVNERETLRDRVTVVPDGLLQATTLPDRWSLVMAMNVIGHFTGPERREIWRLLAERLAPGGRAVVNLPPPAEPIEVPETLAATAEIGRRRYEGWARAEPTGNETLTWHMTYRIFQDGEPTDELVVTYPWHLVDESDMRDELTEAGLRTSVAEPESAGIYLITPNDR